MVKNFKLGLILGSLILVAFVCFVMAALEAPGDLIFYENTTPEYDNDGTFFVNWSAVANAENYTIFIYADDVMYTAAPNVTITNYTFTNTTFNDVNYTFTIQAENTTASMEANSTTNISMVVDLTNPAIEYNAIGMDVDNANVSQSWVAINISGVYDLNNATAASINFVISNSTGIWNQTNFTDSYATTTINWTGLVDGIYYYNVTVNDSATNENSTTTRTITLDTTNPAIEYNAIGMDVDNANVSQNWVSVNITASDTNNATISYAISNSTGIWNQTNFTDSYATTTINWTGLVDGIYYYNVTVNDTATNDNTTATRTITLDTTNPVASLSCSPSSVSQGTTTTCTCSGTDTGGSGVASYTAATTPSTASTGTYTAPTCTVTDYAGNSASVSTVTYSVSGISSSGGGGSGSSSTSFWTKGTHSVSSEQFAEGFTKQLSARQRIKVKVDSGYHHVGIVGLTATAATINISSDPQQAVLAIGDERKFEVSGDNYYDILVKLNSIENNKADITIQLINELISEESVAEEATKEEEAVAGEEQVLEISEEDVFSLWWIFGGLVIIVVLAVVLVKKKKKK